MLESSILLNYAAFSMHGFPGEQYSVQDGLGFLFGKL